jgi:hypothetical protein
MTPTHRLACAALVAIASLGSAHAREGVNVPALERFL